MKILILLFVFILTGCASNSKNRDSMIMRAISYVPKATQHNLSGNNIEHIAEVANDGLSKFPLNDLYRFNQLKLKIIRSSLKNCQSFLHGTAGKEESFEALDDQEYDEFSKLLANTFTLGTNYELKGTPRPSKALFEKTLAIVYSAPPSMFTKYNEKIPAQSECATIEKIMSYIDEKRNTAAETLVRYISSF